MSTISSSTTTTTAYTVSADTTGTLVIQTGATPTTAVTVNGSGALGVGSSPSYGTSGQVLTSAGSSAVPTWSTVSAASLTTPSFTSTIGVGSATASSSGAGVTFPATQSASSNANTLDDYEEGTWTPTVGGTSTYSLQEGTYTKIGNLVNLYGRIIISSIGSGSTSRITGLPFNAAGGDYSGSVSYRSSLSATFASIAPEIGSVSASLINFGTTSIVGNYTSETVIFQNSSRIAFNIFYFV
jgi:hypothetical protein